MQCQSAQSPFLSLAFLFTFVVSSHHMGRDEKKSKSPAGLEAEENPHHPHQKTTIPSN
jgi:hypothetical protein